jgi:hypothetical protein
MRDSRILLVAALGLAGAFFAGAAFFGAAPAHAQQTSAPTYGNTVSQNNRFIAATGSVGSGMSVLWLVDTEAKRVLIYGTNSMGKNIELRAARNIEWDVKLDEYNDDSAYKVEDLKNLAEKHRHEPAPPAKEGSPGGPPKEGQK